MDNFIYVTLALGIILFIIGITIELCFPYYYNEGINTLGFILKILGLIILIICVIASLNKKTNLYDKAEIDIDNGYEVYLDGTQINPDKIIDIRNYKIKIDDESKSVILSN